MEDIKANIGPLKQKFINKKEEKIAFQKAQTEVLLASQKEKISRKNSNSAKSGSLNSQNTSVAKIEKEARSNEDQFEDMDALLLGN